MEEDKNENMKEILDIVKSNYCQYYERTQNLDNKSGFFIAFHGAVLFLLVRPENINKILNMNFQNIGQILKHSSVVILQIFILFFAIISICLFIWSLKSRTIDYMTATICDEKYYNCKNMDLYRELLKTYKEISENNEKILDKKHKLYNCASIITLVEVVLIGINFCIQMI